MPLTSFATSCIGNKNGCSCFFCKKLHPLLLLPFDCSWPHLCQQAINKKSLEFFAKSANFHRQFKTASAEFGRTSAPFFRIRKTGSAQVFVLSNHLYTQIGHPLFQNVLFIFVPGPFARSNHLSAHHTRSLKNDFLFFRRTGKADLKIDFPLAKMNRKLLSKKFVQPKTSCQKTPKPIENKSKRDQEPLNLLI